ncbi:MAG: hypothetical protein KDA22_05835 [Phycisphaerales bacterium]|nr:hypothetical protein [Phycisphaerales bacterium]
MADHNSNTPDPLDSGAADPERSQFDACVAACFGELPAESVRRLEQDPEAGRLLRQLEQVVATLAEPALAAPPRELRQRVVDLLPSRESLLRRWLQAVERVVAQLVPTPPTVALAGLRTASAPLLSYRTGEADAAKGDSASTPPLDAWVDLQLEAVPGTVVGRRLRGQVSLTDENVAPVQVHALHPGGTDRIDSVPVDPDGGFLLELDAEEVDLLVELSDAHLALAIPSIRLRG